MEGLSILRISKERGKSTKYLSTFEALKKEFLDLFFWTKGLDQHYFLFNIIFSLMQHLIVNKGSFFFVSLLVLLLLVFKKIEQFVSSDVEIIFVVVKRDNRPPRSGSHGQQRLRLRGRRR